MAGVVWRCGCGYGALLSTPACPACGWELGAPPDDRAVAPVGAAVVDAGRAVRVPRHVGVVAVTGVTSVAAAAVGWHAAALVMGRLEVVVVALFSLGVLLVVAALAGRDARRTGAERPAGGGVGPPTPPIPDATVR